MHDSFHGKKILLTPLCREILLGTNSAYDLFKVNRKFLIEEGRPSKYYLAIIVFKYLFLKALIEDVLPK